MSAHHDTQLARQLVDLFYPLVELTIFDKHGALQEIINAFSTLKEDRDCDVKNVQTDSHFHELLAAGRRVRCLIYPIYQGKVVAAYLRLRYDLTHFKNLQEQLDFLIQQPGGNPPFESTDQWRESIDRLITHYLSENTINLSAANAKQKRELILRVQEKGLFDFKESSAYVATKLKISRATLYNYLKTASNFKKVRIHQVDAFTSERFGGNPAGVVLDADELDEGTMRKITRELNLSETAFVLNSQKGLFRLRYFTPTGHEISFCGHSTVGALFMVAKERRFGIENIGMHSFEVETLCGILKMEATVDEQGEIHVAYEAPAIKLRQTEITHEDVARAAGFDSDLINASFPVMFEETNRDLFVVVNTLKDLEKCECEAKSFAQFSKLHGIVALCVLCPHAFDKKNQFHMRCYAPMVGIAEDPFTGSVLGGLAAYADTFGLLPAGTTQFHVEQGHFIERPGVVKVQFSKKKGAYHAKVLAKAVHCFSTEINLT